MALHVTVPVSTEVIESNPDCTISGAYEEGVLMITIDTRDQNSHQRLGLDAKTRLHWGSEHVLEAQELSALAWPIRYRVLTRDGYYIKDGQRVHFTTAAKGVEARRAILAMAGTYRVSFDHLKGKGHWVYHLLFPPYSLCCLPFQYSRHNPHFLPCHISPGDGKHIAPLHGLMRIEEEHGIDKPRLNGRALMDDALNPCSVVDNGQNLELLDAKEPLMD